MAKNKDNTQSRSMSATAGAGTFSETNRSSSETISRNSSENQGSTTSSNRNQSSIINNWTGATDTPSHLSNIDEWTESQSRSGNTNNR